MLNLNFEFNLGSCCTPKDDAPDCPLNKPDHIVIIFMSSFTFLMSSFIILTRIQGTNKYDYDLAISKCTSNFN